MTRLVGGSPSARDERPGAPGMPCAAELAHDFLSEEGLSRPADLIQVGSDPVPNEPLPCRDERPGAPGMPCAAELAHDFLSEEGLSRPADLIQVGSDPVPNEPLPCVVAIGAFDGVHRGHLDLLARAARDAGRRAVELVAVTFDPDPDEVVSAHPAPKLTVKEDRLRALALSGARVAVVPFTRELAALDHVGFFRALALSGARVAVVPFTRELAALDHVGFFEGVLAPYLDMRAIHVGADFCLGARGASTVDVMSAWGCRRGVDVTGHELLSDARGPITATRIRSMIAGGRVEEAALDLGRRPFVRGVVKPGRGQGTGMGFPTANIEVPGGMQMPADGVYAGLSRSTGSCAHRAPSTRLTTSSAPSIVTSLLSRPGMATNRWRSDDI